MASSGGARAAIGQEWQADVFAYWASMAVTDMPLEGFDYPADVRIVAIGSDTGFAVDDIGVELSNSGFIQIQAKSGMRRLEGRQSDLRHATDQLVDAWHCGIGRNGARPLQAELDRLVLAVDIKSSSTFGDLGKALDRLRHLPRELPLWDAAVTKPELAGLQAFVSALHWSWEHRVGRSPSEQDLRSLLRLTAVVMYDLEPGGRDHTRSCERLGRATIERPFDTLSKAGHAAAAGQTWFTTGSLARRVGIEVSARIEELRQALDVGLNQMVEESHIAAEGVQPEELPTIDRIEQFFQAVGSFEELTFPLVILGDGGLGKSVLIGQIHEWFKSETRDSRRTAFIACSRVRASSPIATYAELDLALASAATGSSDPSRLTELFAYARQAWGSRPLVCIDTIDLVLREDNADDVALLIRELSQYADLILTCREREWEDYKPFPSSWTSSVWTIPSLTPFEVLDWARRFVQMDEVDNERASRFIEKLRQLVDSVGALPIFATPLRLGMACLLYAPEGDLPDDLTVTSLYTKYWTDRVGKDRRGRRGQAAQQQTRAAEHLSELIWASCGDRFIENVAMRDIERHVGSQALMSEGVVRSRGLLGGFFHQTFAEYAVARILAATGQKSDWVKLDRGLRLGIAGFWGVAGHLLNCELDTERYLVVSQAIPRDLPEGVRLLLKSTVDRSDEELLCQTLKDLRAQQPELLSSAADVLASNPEHATTCGMGVIVELLAITSRHVGNLVNTMARLLEMNNVPDSTHLVLSAGEAIKNGRVALREDVADSEHRRLFSSTVGRHPADYDIALMAGSYGKFPAPTRAEMIRVVARQVPNPDIDASLLGAALKQPCPERAVNDAADVMRRVWIDDAARGAIGWSDWRSMVEKQYPRRWDYCQSRLLAWICNDEESRLNVVQALLQEDLTNRAKYNPAAVKAADAHPNEFAELMMRVGVRPQRPSISSAGSIIEGLAPHVTQSLRRDLWGLLLPLERIDLRAVWVALARLALYDDEMLDELLRKLTRKRNSRDWTQECETARRSVIDLILRREYAPLDARHQAALIALASGDERQDRRNQARLHAKLALSSESSRTWIEVLVCSNSQPTSVRAAVDVVVKDSSQWSPTYLVECGVPWLVRMLKSNNGDAVRTLANLVAETPRDYPWSAASTEAVVSRLLRSLQIQEDPQVSESLLKVLSAVVREGEEDSLTSRHVECVINGYSEALERLLGMPNDPTDEAAPAIHAQLLRAVTQLALTVIPH